MVTINISKAKAETSLFDWRIDTPTSHFISQCYTKTDVLSRVWIRLGRCMWFCAEETDIAKRNEIFSGNDLKKLMPRIVPARFYRPNGLLNVPFYWIVHATNTRRGCVTMHKSRWRDQHVETANRVLLYRVNCLWKKIVPADFELWITWSHLNSYVEITFDTRNSYSVVTQTQFYRSLVPKIYLFIH